MVVSKDVKVKADWKDVKVNPVKNALNSLFEKDKEGLDISDELVGEAVANDSEYTGPAHNSVVSSDGKVQIRNFEVFWTSTDEDTITLKERWEDKWYSFSNWTAVNWSRSQPRERETFYRSGSYSSETNVQINWALSGEKIYNKGDMEITLPLFAYNNDEALKFSITGYSIPKVVFNEDGSINYDANYKNATLAYYYDKETKSTKIINILDLAPGASGTLTLTYGDFDGNVRFVKDSEVAAFQPTLSLKYNNEVLKTKDKELKIKLDTIFDARLVKEGRGYDKWQSGYHSWESNWGDDIKPENPDDYFYVKYKINSQVDDTLQTNLDIKLTDVLGEVYSDGKKVDVEQEIVAYSDMGSDKLTNLPKEEGKIEFNYNLNVGENESKYDYKGNRYIYRKIHPEAWHDQIHPAYKNGYFYVLVKISKEKLGYKENQSYRYKFKNNAELEVSPNNSNQKKIIRKATYTAELNYTYYPPAPKVDFKAPAGNNYQLLKHHYEGFGGLFSRNYNNSWIKTYNRLENKYKNRDIDWLVEGNAKMLYQTYNPEKGSRDELFAYGHKEYILETVDDYLYLADDYQNPLTSNDYEVYSVAINIQPQKYTQYNETSAFYYSNTYAIVPTKILAGKDATGEWVELASFDYDNSGSTFDEKVLNFKSLYEGVELKAMKDFSYKNDLKKDFENDQSYGSYLNGIRLIGKDDKLPLITIPSGFSSVKMQNKTNAHGLHTKLYVNGTLKMSRRVKKYIDSTFKKSSYYDGWRDHPYEFDIKLRNDSTLAAHDEQGNLIGLNGTTKRSENNSKTLDLDLENYGSELYHDTAYAEFKQEWVPPIPDAARSQYLTKAVGSTKNNVNNKTFIISCNASFNEDLNYIKSINDVKKNFHTQESGKFYDLLPLGVTGVQNVNILSNSLGSKGSINNDVNFKKLKTSYKLIPNWRNSGRIMMIASFDGAKFNDYYYHYNGDGLINNKKGSIFASNGLVLKYNMIYPWDSYKDYGSKIDRNLVAYESGFEKRPGDGLDDSLTSDLESGYKDDPTERKEWGDRKLFTDQEIEWIKDLNPNHDEKRFLYAQASTAVSGDTEANVGLTKHVSTDINPNFTLKSSTKEGGNYQYNIRLQAAHGTSVSNLVFFDSIENYDPLKADEDYGIKQWRGTLSSIDLTHPIMKGIAPKVYVSTKPKLDIEKHNDVSDSSVWKLYKEGDDLSNVQAVAIDLRKNKDGSDFKLEQDTAINVYLNMKAPWNLKEKQIDPKAKALNAIYASNTVTTSLDNKSTKLIYTAYTAVDLKPVTTETQIKATKKHLDKEGKDIALKGKDFTFELKDSEGKVFQTKTNDNKGNITFDPIKYNSWDVGEHTYTIEEIKGNDNKIDYDKHIETVKVNVERVGDSELKATVIYNSDGANFINKEKRTAALQIVKLIDGINEVALDSIKDSNESILSYKVSEKDKDKVLDGAEYDLYKVSDDKQTTVVTKLKTVNGVSKVISDLEPGKYFLKETKAPEGYEINPHKIEINIKENDLGTIKVVFVNDKAKPGMPSTGVFPIKLIAIGSNIVLLSLGIYLLKKRKTSNI